MSLSRWQIWDFFASHPNTLLRDLEGVVALNTFDPVCLKLIKDFLMRGIGDKVIHTKLASDVSVAWIEEEFKTLSLFSNTDNFFVHMAQDLSSELLDQIFNLDLKERFLLLSFDNEQSSWKKVVKNNKVAALQIESPRFWELNKLLDFVCTYLRLPLSFDAKAWILESVENNLTSFYHSCCLIKLNYPDAREIGLGEVRDLLVEEKLDQFALASLLARKRFRDFFEKISSLEGDFDKMRGFFMFLQSHLIKMIDPSYLSDKPRLSQYDKDIQASSKLWKETELMKEIELFNRWEILCKKKDPSLWQEIRLAYFKYL